MKNNLPPVHPGKHIKQGLEHFSLSNAEAARILGCSRAFIGDMINGKRNLSIDMCFKLASLLGSTPEMWVKLQTQYDMKMAELDTTLLGEVKRIRQGAKKLRAFS